MLGLARWHEREADGGAEEAGALVSQSDQISHAERVGDGTVRKRRSRQNLEGWVRRKTAPAGEYTLSGICPAKVHLPQPCASMVTVCLSVCPCAVASIVYDPGGSFASRIGPAIVVSSIRSFVADSMTTWTPER
jgi:hypothetical protein